MRNTIKVLLCANLAAFTATTARKKSTPSQVNREPELGRLTALEQNGHYAQAGQYDEALQQMRKRLNILDQAIGTSDPKYLAAQISYSQVLDRLGEHDEAVRVNNSAQQALRRGSLEMRVRTVR